MRGLVTITQESNISDWLWLWEEYASYEARTRECPNGKYSYEWFMYASDALLEKIGVRTEGCVVPTSSNLQEHLVLLIRINS